MTIDPTELETPFLNNVTNENLGDAVKLLTEHADESWHSTYIGGHVFAYSLKVIELLWKRVQAREARIAGLEGGA